jgi:flagellin
LIFSKNSLYLDKAWEMFEGGFMGLRINNNSDSAFSAYHLQKTDRALSESLTRLSTGKRITKAADDAAGMVIAHTLESQAMGFGQAIQNAKDATSIAQVADGALGQATDIIQDIRAKAVQASSAAQSPESRQAIQADISKNLESLKNIAGNTSFNGQQLLSGTFTGKTFQVGASSGEVAEISLGSIDPAMIPDESSGTLAGIDVTTPEGARAAVGISDAALEYIGRQQSRVGSTQNQLESTIQNLTHSQISTLASASEIEDLDYAEESMEINRIKLLSQARAFAQAKAGDAAKHMVDLFG